MSKPGFSQGNELKRVLTEDEKCRRACLLGEDVPQSMVKLPEESAGTPHQWEAAHTLWRG